MKGSRVAGLEVVAERAAQPLTGAGPVPGRGRAGDLDPTTAAPPALLGRAQVGVPGQEHGDRGADEHDGGDRREARRTSPATSPPMGTVPPKLITHTALARPRTRVVEAALEHRGQRRDGGEVEEAEHEADRGTPAPASAAVRRR